MSYSGPNVPASAINPMIESPYIPSTESTVSGRSSSPEHPGERVADSSMPQHTSLAMQYVNHANMSTTGYAYAEHGRLHGVTDVDVDEKPHLVYETMTDLQAARQRMAMNGGPSGLASNHVDGEKYAGIPNKPVKQYSATLCLIKVIWNLFLFILVVGAFGLSVYNFLNQNSTANPGTNLGPTPPTVSTMDPSQLTGDEDIGVSFDEYNATVTELRAELERQSSRHENRYQELNNTIFSAVESVKTVSPNNELDLTAGCGAPIETTCVLNHNNVGTPPASLTCETPEHPLDEAGFRNVNIYCSVDNSVAEINPITSTLNIYNGEVSCLCSLVALTAPTASPSCKLTIQRCPDTIRLNTTNMR